MSRRSMTLDPDRAELYNLCSHTPPHSNEVVESNILSLKQKQHDRNSHPQPISSPANVHLLHTLRNAVIVLLLSNPSVKKTERFNLCTKPKDKTFQPTESKPKHFSRMGWPQKKCFKEETFERWASLGRCMTMHPRQSFAIASATCVVRAWFSHASPWSKLDEHEGVTAPLRIRSPRHPGYTSRVMFESLTIWSNLLLSVWLSPICGRVRTYWRPI